MRTSGRSDGLLNPAAGIAIAGLLLIVATQRMPYAFYGFMRWTVFLVCLYGAWWSYAKRAALSFWILLILGLFFGPLVNLRMRRAQWEPLDLVGGAVLIGIAALIWWQARGVASRVQGAVYLPPDFGRGAAPLSSDVDRDSGYKRLR